MQGNATRYNLKFYPSIAAPRSTKPELDISLTAVRFDMSVSSIPSAIIPVIILLP